MDLDYGFADAKLKMLKILHLIKNIINSREFR